MIHQATTSAPKYIDLVGLRLRFGRRSLMFFTRLMARPVNAFPSPSLGGRDAVRLQAISDIEAWKQEEAARTAALRAAL